MRADPHQYGRSQPRGIGDPALTSPFESVTLSGSASTAKRKLPPIYAAATLSMIIPSSTQN